MYNIDSGIRKQILVLLNFKRYDFTKEIHLEILRFKKITLNKLTIVFPNRYPLML